MKHTPENLREMSDFEINELIASILFPDATFENVMLSPISSSRVMNVKHGQFPIPSYCSNPNDIMPAQIENLISLDWYHERVGRLKLTYWTAIFNNGESRFVSHNSNALRAICEVFILMMQEKSDD